MNYCGFATLFKGVWVNVCSAMGIPSSETALEEVMCHVLGPLLRDESVAKSADDLYCSGNTAFLYIHNDVTQTRRPAVDCHWWGTQGPWNRRHPLRDARRQVTCLCPESALLAHTKHWMAFWPLLTYNSTPHLKMDWNLGWFGLEIFFLKTELVSSTLRTVVIKFIYSPTRFF